ncbi:hypothetical protein CHS0354_039662 [Potamilus streckersoni]|uniref:Uncharacterized protein n=1 Tax=Potamilus streckersoni TaxID=2493646 RepID=A0AAE0VWZ0_9BIVA|nr:hypothetical protein CHS0354_039662 [Potamilus streckersoni]
MVVLRSNFIKCVVIGDENVGKTSLLMSYATDQFPTQHVPSVFDNYAGCICLSGKQYNLQLIDTLDERSAENNRCIYPGTDVFVVCFSVINPESFKNVERKWVPEIRRYMGDVPFIVVGTKADLRQDDKVNRQLQAKCQYPVSYSDATKKSKQLGASCYIECSPRMPKRMRKVVNDALLSVFQPQWESPNTPSCSIL